LRGKESISVITFVLVGIIALFVLAGIVTVNDGVHGRL
jgi:Flp pilus assembly pilin Flp